MSERSFDGSLRCRFIGRSFPYIIESIEHFHFDVRKIYTQVYQWHAGVTEMESYQAITTCKDLTEEGKENKNKQRT